VRRAIVAGLTAITLLFLASVLLLDRLDDRQPTQTGRPELPASPAVTVTPSPPRPPPVVPVPAAPSAEVSRQLAAPPTAPIPEEPAEPLPPSGAPPAPAYVRENLRALEARLSSRCGKTVLRLGDQLRAERRAPEGHAVLLLEIEPRDDEARVVGSTLQSAGSTRPSLVACAQFNLRGFSFPVSYLRKGERVKVQAVVGTASP
jgi:hypothetical protein